MPVPEDSLHPATALTSVTRDARNRPGTATARDQRLVPVHGGTADHQFHWAAAGLRAPAEKIRPFQHDSVLTPVATGDTYGTPDSVPRLWTRQDFHRRRPSPSHSERGPRNRFGATPELLSRMKLTLPAEVTSTAHRRHFIKTLVSILRG